jgi:hypothetical protein
LTTTIQHESPSKEKKANWLPALAEGLFLNMRLHQPEERVYRGEYIVPPVQRCNVGLTANVRFWHLADQIHGRPHVM